jgi:adenylate cyclase
MASQGSVASEIAGRIATGFAREARSGIRHATIARSAALLTFIVWISIFQEFPRAWFYIDLLGLLLILGFAQGYVAGRVAPRIWPSAIFILIDSGVLVVALAAPNPFVAIPLPSPLVLRSGNFSLFYVLLAGSLLTYSPRLVLWSGVTGAAAWGGAVAWIASLPDSRTQFDIIGWGAMEPVLHLPFRMDPNFVTLPQHVKELLVFIAVTLILATVVWRLRRLAFRQVEVERERANLARHFSPNMVDTLARSDEPLGTVRRQHVAVLFADIVGFSGLAERLGPDRTMELLRRTHSLISREIFAHHGTLDKFIGDAVMATFGVPIAGPDDAANAIACALSIRKVLATENLLECEPVKVGIGAHFGEVVMGDIGGEHRLEFGVIGDTVNVASRLEGLTRELGPIIVSDELFAAAGGGTANADGFRLVPGRKLRGREEPIDIWVLDGDRP